jgi:hypothetical protein
MHFQTATLRYNRSANLPAVWSHFGRLAVAKSGNGIEEIYRGGAQYIHTLGTPCIK